MRNKNWTRRLLALCLVTAMLFTALPGGLGFRAEAVTSANRVADAPTYDSWKEFFPTQEGSLHTEEAGAVWTDKSVFKPAEIPSDWESVADTGDNFLVALSALAANKTVKGYSSLPTDTMLVLDVSASMGRGENGNRSADDMVVAANNAIDRLMRLNKNNRVGVVLYSGNSQVGASQLSHATVLLPLGRYTTTSADSQGNPRYLAYYAGDRDNPERVSLLSAVSQEGGGSVTGASKNVSGGTYIQSGLYYAAQQLRNANPIVTEGVQAGTVRIPIMVLMSDGAPTAATTSYTVPGRTNYGDGTQTSNEIAFLTQLTAAYEWEKVEDWYGREGLFYTLGLGVSNEAQAEAVLDPANRTTSGISNYWTRYLRLADGASMTVTGNNTVQRTDVIGSASRNYVTKYYEATGSDLGQSLIDSFQKIVDEIILQSRYYPTLVDEGDPDLDGYVTFRDEIGKYMEVTQIHGIRINGVLHTGELLAKNFVPGGGDLGNQQNPQPLGDELVNAVRKRLGITNVDEARTLLNNAYFYGQLSYTSPDDFSNYIGWFGDANETFVDFWYEGMPESDYPSDAVFINKSYCFLGDVDTAHGIAASDMMYTMVRVRQRIRESADGSQKVGEVIVDWSVPAALIPTITYQVELNGDNYDSGVKDISVEAWKDAAGNTVDYVPIRLMYEVALREDINSLNILEKTGGQTTFYSNAWNSDPGDTSVNTFSHFEPSKANERFYFSENKDIYIFNGTDYVPYTGSEPAWAEDTYFHAHIHFDAGKGDNGVVTVFEPLTQVTFNAKVAGEGGTWYIPSGTIHRYYHDVQVQKAQGANATNTLVYSLYPHIESSGSRYYVTSTLGNNGRLSVAPATGITLTKVLEGAQADDRSFTFEITGGTEAGYTVTPKYADGTEGASYTAAVTEGKATVTLKPGQTVYITGMTEGVTYTVTEKPVEGFKVDSITGGTASGNAVSFQAQGQTLLPVVFVNAPKTVGGVYISKIVSSDTSYPQGVKFDITVTLAGNENTPVISTAQGIVDPATYTYASGVISGLQIQHGQTYYIANLTEGTQVTVTETLPAGSAGFTQGVHTSADYPGAVLEQDAAVTVHGQMDSTVVLNNRYTAAPVSVEVGFAGTKNFNATEMAVDSTFQFKLQTLTETGWADVEGKTASVTVAAGENATGAGAKTFAIPAISLTLDRVGVHSYQILEVPGSDTDVTYDPSVYTFGVYVTDAGDGTLKAELITHVETGDTNFSSTANGANSWTVNTTFNNEYHTASTYLDIKKEVLDPAGVGVTPAGFKVSTYYALVTEGPDGAKTWAFDGEAIRSDTTDTAGEIRFVRSYDATDFVNDTDGDNLVTYHFLMKEEPVAPTGSTGAWSFDETVYQITVLLSRENADSQITAKFVIDRVKADGTVEHVITEADNKNSAVLTFQNTYQPETVSVMEPINTIPTVMKELVGRPLAEGEFSFLITEAGDMDGDGRENETVATGKNLADGAKGDAIDNVAWVAFTEVEKGLTFHKVGTYRYKIQEQASGLPGVTDSQMIYSLVVVVTEENGQLKADYFFEDAIGKTVIFVNSYRPAATTLDLYGTKVLTGGRQLFAGEFQFQLVEMTDGTYQTAKEGGLTLTAANTGGTVQEGKAEGSIHFTGLAYDRVGTHYYKVTELDGSKTDLGVTYSTDEAYIKVVVTDDTAAGKLRANATYTMRDAAGEEMVFTNAYQPQPGQATLSVNKVLEGRTLDDGEFTFALFKAKVTQENGKDVWTITNEEPVRTTNSADGKINFQPLYFSSKGTYRYILKEIVPSDLDGEGYKDGVHYDDTEFRITIRVTDDWKGNLVTETEIQDQNGLPYSVIVFNNTYAIADGSLTLEGTKTLTGRDMLEGEQFTFVITEDGQQVSSATVTGLTDGKETKFSFQPIAYTADDIGTHTYVVTEANQGTAGISYDPTVYTLKVTVSDNRDGTLKIQLAQENPAVLAFTNTYTPPADVTLDVHAVKTVKNLGALKMGPEGFQFQVVDVETGEKVLGTSDKEGKALMQLSFTAADAGKTFTYRISEIDTAKAHVTYSKLQYTIQVAVALEQETNQLVLTVTNNGKTIDQVVAPFENIYEEDPPVTPDTGDTTPLMLMSLLMLASAAALVLLAWNKKRVW